ncbi:PE-PGRS family protein [Ammonifex degensii KC4]|uniref:Peptide chain release factor 2 n=1 Tax=Ammonifex degensii (strain DSM 10501 / KC4) TaxID=429009 RepID=C9RBJ1_AMMDK|nr:peptide chain release factor 2 [Ammonifex degensii]ACX51618.1 PE-PGRS family protein [Ammonifex degensii KC4]
MVTELERELEVLAERLKYLEDSLDLAQKEKRLALLEKEMEAPDFWRDLARAQAVTQEVASLRQCLGRFYRLREGHEELSVLLELAAEEGDAQVLAELAQDVKKLAGEIEDLEVELLLSGPYDASNAIVSLHAGAGGTDAQDWVAMLLRMYARWAEAHGYRIRTLDLLTGEEAGIKSVTFEVIGPRAYGYLKAERGVHRLIRISPFDASGRRHTSFASVDVLPAVKDDTEIKIAPEELRIDTFRASGAGGQHVNKTETAVRITHLPTGITVTCQSERSQSANKAAAMEILRARLLDLKIKEREKELAALRGEVKEIAWGNQIRTYVLHPYTLVKDHRTGVERRDIQAVLDGDIDDFIRAYLKVEARKQAEAAKAAGMR